MFCRFVCLQLYLLPAVVSFKTADMTEDKMNVLNEKMVVILVGLFVASGPLIHLVVTAAIGLAPGFFSLQCLVSFPLSFWLSLTISLLLSLSLSLSLFLSLTLFFSPSVSLSPFNFSMINFQTSWIHFVVTAPVLAD